MESCFNFVFSYDQYVKGIGVGYFPFKISELENYNKETGLIGQYGKVKYYVTPKFLESKTPNCNCKN